MKGKAIILCTALLSLGWNAEAAKSISERAAGNPPPEIMAGCAPATSAADMDINNVRTLIQSGGDMWWDLIGAPKYEVPKGSGKNALFLGSLWLGGQDVSGQLKVAAQRYRSNGNDFWTGPLSTANAEIDAQTCSDWDRHFITTRAEVAEFVGWWQCQNDPSCDVNESFPNYQIPLIILEWPAHGRNYAPYDEDFYLAPFTDHNGDGVYNPLDGDYPAFDLKGELECQTSKLVNLYGDQNLWWIFNDKGNVHTESGANQIGMEIRAQAFAFATNDEVNNMTFYNYEMHNRSSFTLTETYFGINIDADLGNPYDDYVGCDVNRGLGYCYNGDENDEDNGGASGYGDKPAAIGVDFFQGPYQDNDGQDNPLTTDINLAENQLGIPYKGLGVGYGDGVIDNERFGMRRFVYYNNGNCNSNCDPSTGVHYYNFLRGIWKDGTPMYYGGTGHFLGGGDPNIEADYMFPDDTDPYGWGTDGNPQPAWSERIEGNVPNDRRFVQSAGPFTLAPGAVNNITVGVVWAQAQTGGAWASVQEMRKADDKTQALFDNCFKILNGPDAPELALQEMDQEIVIYIDNCTTSNNFNEEYEEVDPFLIPPDSVDSDNDGVMDIALTAEEKELYATYHFQGYQLYQVKDNAVSVTDLEDPDRARLIAQVDKKDGIGQLVNFYFDEGINANTPVEEVDGEDKGIRHSFQVFEDQFAEGDKKLVNHKTYYFICIAYGYNNFGDGVGSLQYVNGEYDPNDPTKLDGQKKPYLASRKACTGGITSYSAIPHKTAPEAAGTHLNSKYGDGVELTRIEGQGNGGLAMDITSESIDKIMAGSPWKVKNPTYEQGKGPVNVKVIDPLAIPAGDFTLAFDSLGINGNGMALDNATWTLTMAQTGEKVISDKSIVIQNEQLILEWGLSVTFEQVPYPTNSDDDPINYGDAFLEATMSFEDEADQWLTGVPDVDGNTWQNWIRSGVNAENGQADFYDYSYTIDQNGSRVGTGIDDDEVYEAVLGGTWAPSRLTSNKQHGPMPSNPGLTEIYKLNSLYPNLRYLQSVDIVITSDKNKWTRCPVIETQDNVTLSQGGVEKGRPRAARSVDKNGEPASSGDTVVSTNPDHPNYISANGMGWFPGYAINIETGERLNMAFGEDSWLTNENGSDMLWNPTENIFEGPFNDVRFGGKHYIYVFRNNIVEESAYPFPPDLDDPTNRMPHYDAGAFTMTQFAKEAVGNTIEKNEAMRAVYRATMWTGLPLLAPNGSLLANDVTVRIRIARPYEAYATGDCRNKGQTLTVGDTYFVNAGPIDHDGTTYERGEYFTATVNNFNTTDNDTVCVLSGTVNAALPMYNFNTHDLATVLDSHNIAVDALDLIGVVPNPYYAYSEYETDKIDNRIKIINLPQTCTVTIYTVNGTLIRKFRKDDPTITSLDWDLKNHANIPISSGMYIIHVDVPGVGERTLKWMGVIRPVALDAF